MCKVYNKIGCLTAIESHLYKHNINEYKSLNELIDFQKNYVFRRQRIISDHTILVEKEKSALRDELPLLDRTINISRVDIEQQLLSEIKKLKLQVDSLSATHTSIIQTIVNS